MSEKSPQFLLQEAEAHDAYEFQAFDIVIPGHIRANPRLSKDAKYLYGILRNLTRKEGYSWATTPYLSRQMECSERSIARYLDDLKSEGYIQTQTISFQMKKRRRIWLSEAYEFKKSLIMTAVSSSSCQPCHDGHDSRGTYTEENILHIEKIPPIPKGITPPLKEKTLQVDRAPHVKTTEEEHAKLVKELGVQKTEACYQCLSEWKEATPKHKWKKGDYLSIRRWVINSVDEKQGKKQWKNQSSATKSKDSSHISSDNAMPAHLFQPLSIFQKTEEK